MNPPKVPHSRQAEVLRAARELVDSLEDSSNPIADCLLKAQRLARVMRDPEAQSWLHHELTGYPERLSPDALGWCKKYAYRFGITDNGNLGVTVRESLPALEAAVMTTKVALEKTPLPSIATAPDNFIASGATKQVIDHCTIQLVGRQRAAANAVAVAQRMRSFIHSYACDVLISVEFSEVVGTMFESAKDRVDAFIRLRCPRAVEQLVAVGEQLRADDIEARSAALTASRRLLHSVADALYPPRPEPVMSGGRERKVGPEAYKNRLLAYVEERSGSKSTNALLSSDLEHVAARLDALYEKSCKGVHDDVTQAEAELTVMQLYVFLGELARLAADDKVAVPVIAPQTPPAS